VSFCTPSEAHEKGGVEGEVGYFRRNHWVPVPKAIDIADLNRLLLAECQRDEHRVIAGREQCIGAAVVVEREHLLPLVPEGMDLARITFPTVNSLGCAKVLTNAYSVPLKAGTVVQAKVYASIVELWFDGRCVARHEPFGGPFSMAHCSTLASDKNDLISWTIEYPGHVAKWFTRRTYGRSLHWTGTILSYNLGCITLYSRRMHRVPC